MRVFNAVTIISTQNDTKSPLAEAASVQGNSCTNLPGVAGGSSEGKQENNLEGEDGDEGEEEEESVSSGAPS